MLSLSSQSVAVVTGGASGIGLAVAGRFADMGLRVCIADLEGRRLAEAAEALAARAPDGAGSIMAVATDVSRIEDVQRLEAAVRERFGGADILMNNAGVQPGSAMFGPNEAWERVISVNLWGVINGARIFAPGMIARGRPGYIVNTGSKQGITTPPGNAAYNVSKAGVKVFTEATAHELRQVAGGLVTAHLLIPGFTHTGLTQSAEKPPAAWTADQVAAFMLDGMARGDFYILCPDNDVDRATDEKRMLWAMGDIVENRPALSRWHPDYKEAFARFMAG